jgi:hypothetical protein
MKTVGRAFCFQCFFCLEYAVILLLNYSHKAHESSDRTANTITSPLVQGVLNRQVRSGVDRHLSWQNRGGYSCTLTIIEITDGSEF